MSNKMPMQQKLEVIPSDLQEEGGQLKEKIIILSHSCDQSNVASVTLKCEELASCPQQGKYSMPTENNVECILGDVMKSEDCDVIHHHEIECQFQDVNNSQIENYDEDGNCYTVEQQVEKCNWVDNNLLGKGKVVVRNEQVKSQTQNRNQFQVADKAQSKDCSVMGMSFQRLPLDTHAVIGRMDLQETSLGWDVLGLRDPGHINRRKMCSGQIYNGKIGSKRIHLGHISSEELDYMHQDSEQIDPLEINSQTEREFSHYGVLEEVENFNFLFRLEAHRALKSRSVSHCALDSSHEGHTSTGRCSAARLHTVRKERSNSGSTVHIEISPG